MLDDASRFLDMLNLIERYRKCRNCRSSPRWSKSKLPVRSPHSWVERILLLLTCPSLQALLPETMLAPLFLWQKLWLWQNSIQKYCQVVAKSQAEFCSKVLQGFGFGLPTFFQGQLSSVSPMSQQAMSAACCNVLPCGRWTPLDTHFTIATFGKDLILSGIIPLNHRHSLTGLTARKGRHLSCVALINLDQLYGAFPCRHVASPVFNDLLHKSIRLPTYFHPWWCIMLQQPSHAILQFVQQPIRAFPKDTRVAAGWGRLQVCSRSCHVATCCHVLSLALELSGHVFASSLFDWWPHWSMEWLLEVVCWIHWMCKRVLVWQASSVPAVGTQVSVRD